MADLFLSWTRAEKAHSHRVAPGKIVVLGRRPDCDVVIPDKTVSRRHAVITASESGCMLENLSSTNPIRVNNEAAVFKGHVVAIKPGDTIQLGKILLKLVDPTEVEKFKIKIKCSNCRKVISEDHKDCPWCGTSLAFGETVVS